MLRLVLTILWACLLVLYNMFAKEFKRDPAINIFVIDDCANDTILLKHAAAAIKRDINFYTLDDEDAMDDFLSRKGQYWDLPIPDLFMIDANLRTTTGFDVVDKIKKDDDYISTKCILMSGVDMESQRVYQEKSYQKPIDSYIIKPVNNCKLKQAIELLLCQKIN